ncbi:hypothetical protein ACA910_015314 [Epithemia clementina (nom. ined.)]
MQQRARQQTAADNNSTPTNEQECHEIQQLLEALRSSLPEDNPQNDEYYNSAGDLDMGFDLVTGRERGKEKESDSKQPLDFAQLQRDNEQG